MNDEKTKTELAELADTLLMIHEELRDLVQTIHASADTDQAAQRRFRARVHAAALEIFARSDLPGMLDSRVPNRAARLALELVTCVDHYVDAYEAGKVSPETPTPEGAPV